MNKLISKFGFWCGYVGMAAISTLVAVLFVSWPILLGVVGQAMWPMLVWAIGHMTWLWAWPMLSIGVVGQILWILFVMSR